MMFLLQVKISRSLLPPLKLLVSSKISRKPGLGSHFFQILQVCLELFTFNSNWPFSSGIAKHMKWGRQEDAHEFLRFLVDNLQQSCLNGENK